jgi:hypothetical protein
VKVKDHDEVSTTCGSGWVRMATWMISVNKPWSGKRSIAHGIDEVTRPEPRREFCQFHMGLLVCCRFTDHTARGPDKELAADERGLARIRGTDTEPRAVARGSWTQR